LLHSVSVQLRGGPEFHLWLRKLSKSVKAEQGANGQIVAYRLPAHPDPEVDIAVWRQKSEGLQLIIADLLYENQKVRTAESLHRSKDDGSANSHTDLLN
jgi:hypothetical protein